MAIIENESTSTSTTVTSENQSNDLVHHNHSLYIHPSNTQGVVLISIQLRGSENYSVWSRSMKIVLHGKNKLGFVLGTYRKELYDSSLYELWERYNAIILAWIMNTVAPNLLSTVIYASNAFKVWEELRERFDKVNAARSFYLHKQIAKLSQNLLTVSEYFSKLRELWDEYEDLAPPPSCGCPKSKQHAEHYQLQKLYQFLTGLNDSFDNAKDQILMIQPLLNVNQAYAMVVNVESQRKNSAALSVGIGKTTTLMSKANAGNGISNFKPRNNFGRPTLQCDYCHLKGHTKDTCYKLHGYLSDFKAKRKGYSNSHVNNAFSAREFQQSTPQSITQPPLQSTSQFSPAPLFTQEQYDQILNMLNKRK